MKDLKRFMERVGASVQDVATGAELHRSAISRILNGDRRNPRHDTLKKLRQWADAEADRLGLRRSERLDLEV